MLHMPLSTDASSLMAVKRLVGRRDSRRTSPEALIAADGLRALPSACSRVQLTVISQHSVSMLAFATSLCSAACWAPAWLSLPSLMAECPQRVLSR